MKVGLKVPLKSTNPLEAFKIFFTKEYEDILINNAKKNCPRNFKKGNINTSLLYQYIAYLILSGIIDLPREKLYFYPEKNLEDFFKKVDFISQAEVRFAKKFFTADRTKLSDLYNKISVKVWNPSQLSIEHK